MGVAAVVRQYLDPDVRVQGQEEVFTKTVVGVDLQLVVDYGSRDVRLVMLPATLSADESYRLSIVLDHAHQAMKEVCQLLRSQAH